MINIPRRRRSAHAERRNFSRYSGSGRPILPGRPRGGRRRDSRLYASVCQSAPSRGTYMRTWRLWVAFNVLNLGLCMRSAWRIYDTDPGSQTRRRDERDVTRFAMLLARRFRNSNTAAQGIPMLRTVHKVRSGQALCPPQEAHQLSATLRGLSDMFPSVSRDRFPVTVQYIEKWSTMYRWRSRELINIFGAASSACSSAYCEQPKPSASTKPSTRQQTSAENT